MKPTKVVVNGGVSFPDIDTIYCRSDARDVLTFYNIRTKRETKDPSHCAILMTKAFISLTPFNPNHTNSIGVGYRKMYKQHIFYSRASLALGIGGHHSIARVTESPRRTLPGDIGLTFTLAGRFHSPIEGIPYNVKKIKLYYEVEGQQCTY